MINKRRRRKKENDLLEERLLRGYIRRGLSTYVYRPVLHAAVADNFYSNKLAVAVGLHLFCDGPVAPTATQFSATSASLMRVVAFAPPSALNAVTSVQFAETWG